MTTPDGGVVIGARADDTTDFGVGTISTAQGQAQMVVAAYDRDGKHLWEQRINGYAIDQVSLAADRDGNVFLAGSTYQNVVIGGTTLSYATFVAKLDSEGTVTWVRSTSKESSYLPALHGLSADEEGNVYLAGYYYYEPFEESGASRCPPRRRRTAMSSSSHRTEKASGPRVSSPTTRPRPSRSRRRKAGISSSR